MKKPNRKQIIVACCILAVLVAVCVYCFVRLFEKHDLSKIEDILRDQGYVQIEETDRANFDESNKEYYVMYNTSSDREKVIIFPIGRCTYFRPAEYLFSPAEHYYYDGFLFPSVPSISSEDQVYVEKKEDAEVRLRYAIYYDDNRGETYIHIWDNDAVLEIQADIDNKEHISLLIKILKKCGYSKYLSEYMKKLNALL